MNKCFLKTNSPITFSRNASLFFLYIVYMNTYMYMYVYRCIHICIYIHTYTYA